MKLQTFMLIMNHHLLVMIGYYFIVAQKRAQTMPIASLTHLAIPCFIIEEDIICPT
jgi:hypothetical protein